MRYALTLVLQGCHELFGKQLGVDARCQYAEADSDGRNGDTSGGQRPPYGE